MEMLLSLHRIPRLHNILATLFNWTLLVGLVLFTASFTSPDTGDPRDAPLRLLPLLSAAVVATGTGTAGLACLAVRWRHNYVWLINRVYLPGALNGVAGLILTVTLVCSQHRGRWNTPTRAVVAVEAAFSLVCAVLFVLYNNLLLARVKSRHEGRGSSGAGFFRKIDMAARQRPFAPGSVV